MIKQRPEYFSAYVGTGQVVSARENEEFNYAHVLAEARAAHNDLALAALAKLGPPPWGKIEQLVEERKWAKKLAARSGDGLNPRASFSAPGLSVIDYYYWFRGPRFSARQIGMAPPSFDLRSLGLDFELPVFFFEGTADQSTPIEPVERYFEEIRAPHKEFVRFEGDHHFVIFNRPDEFLGELRLKVLPQLRK
jgi:pimeloyl-ACP methyl ester carboxylesterase